MQELIDFNRALRETASKTRSLLLGNGFSYDHANYRTLLDKAPLRKDDPIKTLFAELKSPNFEAAMRALNDAAVVETAYGNAKHAAELKSDAVRLGAALVEAIRAAHPKSQKDLQPLIPACRTFLGNFGKIFTLNYDLLLYFVIVGSPKFGDGFGLAQRENGFLRPFKNDRRCNVFNLHGALHLFKTDDNSVEKRIEDGGGILEAINRTIVETGRVPTYVAEGSSAAKLAQIRNNFYLRTCYDELSALNQAVFIFGSSADETDNHIYDAIFGSHADEIFYCFHAPTANLNQVEARLAHAQKRNGSTVRYRFVDAESVGAWG